MTREERAHLASMDRDEMASLQLSKLREMLQVVLPRNAFYRAKIGDVAIDTIEWEDFCRWPVTTKEELQCRREDGLACHHTFSREAYVRYHQTSGTKGEPLPIYDTQEDWQRWNELWQWVLDVAGLSEHDRVMLAFSFGPFIGFWSAFDAVVARGAIAIPGGGMSSPARLQLIDRSGANVLLCTPTYAMHLADVARSAGREPESLPIEKIIVAGEPGGSLISVRERIESMWGAEVFDHAGATEIGPWGYPDENRAGIRIAEHAFIAEFESVETGKPGEEGELSHLLLTTLDRPGAPVIRYRTGDLVRPSWRVAGPDKRVLLEGGIVGRGDDMLIVRGVNVFPSSLEEIIRRFPAVREFRLTARQRGAMDDLLIEIEDQEEAPGRVALEIEKQLGLKLEVRCVETNSLPRSEAKSRRLIRE